MPDDPLCPHTVGILTFREEYGEYVPHTIPLVEANRVSVTAPDTKHYARQPSGQPLIVRVRSEAQRDQSLYIELGGAGTQKPLHVGGNFPPEGQYRVALVFETRDLAVILFENASNGQCHRCVLGDIAATLVVEQ